MTSENIEIVKKACRECGGVSVTFIQRKFKLSYQAAYKFAEVIIHSTPSYISMSPSEQETEIDTIKTSILKLQDRIVSLENELVRMFATKTFK